MPLLYKHCVPHHTSVQTCLALQHSLHTTATPHYHIITLLYTRCFCSPVAAPLCYNCSAPCPLSISAAQSKWTHTLTPSHPPHPHSSIPITLRLSQLLFPTLIAACYQREENTKILLQEISPRLLVPFLQGAKATGDQQKEEGGPE